MTESTVQPRSLLLIEDEELIRLTVSDHLRDNGHLVQEASSGARGLELFDPGRHDTVLLDLRLGDTDGHTVLARIRERTSETPVIIISGAGDMQDVIKALRIGASDFLTKPILDFTLLDHALAKAWERLDLLRENNRYASDLEDKVRARTAELAKANRHLQENEELIRLIMDTIPEIFWLRDLQPLRARYISQACEPMLGLSRDLLLHDATPLLQCVHPEDRERAVAIMDSPPARDGEENTIRFLRPDGQTRWLRMTTFGIPDATGACTRIAGIVSDITEQVIAAERERENQQRLIQADKMISLGILAAGVAHEINNPNHLIRLNAQALDSIRQLREQNEMQPDADPLPASMQAEVPGLLRGILGASDRIRDIVRHMKDFARPDATHEEQDVDAGAVVRDALALLRTTLAKQHTRIDVDIAENLPPVRGSHQRLEQVIVNLLLNASEALGGQDGCVTVRVRPDGRDRILLEVRDKGTGLTEDARQRAFDPFFTTKRDQGGLGLGLAICHSIVQAHGGSIEFHTPDGPGTIVRVLLPVGGASA